MLDFVFTGDRTWNDIRSVAYVIESLCTLWEPSMIAIHHGKAKGLDTIVDVVAKQHGCTVYSKAADWMRYGKAAGMLRNEELLQCKPICLFAYPLPQSIGTRGMISLSNQYGIPLYVYDIQSNSYEGYRTGTLAKELQAYFRKNKDD